MTTEHLSPAEKIVLGVIFAAFWLGLLGVLWLVYQIVLMVAKWF